MHRNRSVNAHNFAMVPRADIPRSAFKRPVNHKTTFNAGDLVPHYVEEILPGDTVSFSMTGFCRLATPITPIMDNLHWETFYFFVPMRLIWDNWQKFMGEQVNPGDSTDYTIPQVTSPVGGYDPVTVFDYMALPTKGQVAAGKTITHSVLPLRAYNLIYNQWFRDENLQASLTVPKDNGPDNYNLYNTVKRGKRPDYFTTCLPWPQKGAAVQLPLGTQAPVKFQVQGGQPPYWVHANDNTFAGLGSPTIISTGGVTPLVQNGGTGFGLAYVPNGTLYADLSTATAATINQIRQSFQVQKLLERDARGGTRYTEIIRSHFGVISPDARLQRPEYLGGGSSPIAINPIAQTGGTGAQGTTTPQGNLAAMGTGLLAKGGWKQSFTEHGYVIGIMMARADLNYQQGLDRSWSRKTRYDFYFPVFSHLGEQAVLSQEIFMDGNTGDTDVFGYQARWDEYRYTRNKITGYFRSTTTGTIDIWHLAEKFATRPALGASFITDPSQAVVQRMTAVGSLALGQQFICDLAIDTIWVRQMPMYGVPGFIDHF